MHEVVLNAYGIFKLAKRKNAFNFLNCHSFSMLRLRKIFLHVGIVLKIK